MATTKATLLGHRSATSFSDLTLSGDLTVNGTTTTLDTAVQNVDKLEIGASSTDYGAKINQASTGNILQLQDGGTDVMVVEDGGKVGIGTNSPQSYLQVNGTGSGGAGEVSITRVDTSQTLVNGSGLGYLYFGAQDGDSGLDKDACQIIASCDEAWSSSAHGSRFEFYTTASGATSATERMRIDSSGNVGIGTTSPDAYSKLHISGGSSDYHTLVVDTTASGGGGMILRHNATYKGYVGTAGSTHLSGSSTDDILIRAANDLIFASGGNNERMRIDQNGKVGIGGTTTGALLTGTSSGSNSANIYLGATGTGNAEIVLDASNGDFAGSDYYMLRQLNDLSVENWLGTSGHYIWKTAGGTERMRITSSGEVLIGTTTASATRLNVTIGTSSSPHGVAVDFRAGNTNPWLFRISSTTYNYRIYAGGSGPALDTGSWINSSDIALKENITDLSNGIEILKTLSPKRFTWKDNGSISYGFIAQDVESTSINEIVGNTNPSGHLTLDYNSVFTTSVKALQECIDKVETLEAKVTELENATN